jgi:hypothetical protein
MRKDKVLYRGDVVSILSISKTSLRVYNVSKDEFVPRWIDDSDCEYLPLNFECLVDLGFKAKDGALVNDNILAAETQLGWEFSLDGLFEFQLKYYHELKRCLDFFQKHGVTT